MARPMAATEVTHRASRALTGRLLPESAIR